MTVKADSTMVTNLQDLDSLSNEEIIVAWSNYFEKPLEDSRQLKSKMRKSAINQVFTMLEKGEKYECGQVPMVMTKAVEYVKSCEGDQIQFSALRNNLLHEGRLLVLTGFLEKDKVELIFALAEQE